MFGLTPKLGNLSLIRNLSSNFILLTFAIFLGFFGFIHLYLKIKETLVTFIKINRKLTR